MTTIQQVGEFLAVTAPLALAEEWDNVGLLVGDATQPAQRIMTCLTITPETAAEAVEQRADLVVTHHPLPFKPLKQLTTSTLPGRLLLRLIRAGVAIHSCHTAFDSAAGGINVALAQGLGLDAIQPLVPSKELTELGSGRLGVLPRPQELSAVADRLKNFLNIRVLQHVGALDRSIQTVAVACGSAGQFLSPARQAGCDLLVTGETSFHTCVEAEATGIAMLLPGHFASERFGMERLAEQLRAHFTDCHIWASRNERDPLQWM